MNKRMKKTEVAKRLNDYIRASGKLKLFIAKELGIRPWELSRLLRADEYDPAIDDALCARLADVLHVPPADVRAAFREVAA